MFQRTRLKMLAVVLAIGVVATACGGGGQGTGGSGQGERRTGGTLQFLSYQEVATLDAGKARSTTGSGQMPLVAIYDMLVDVLPDGTIKPRLAESVTTTDQQVWTITLRDGLKFSDGTPFDANAVKAAWDRMGDPTTASPSAGQVKTMQTYEVVDARTLRVTLKQKNSQWARYLMRGLGMIPSPTAVEARGADFAKKPVGAGPFTVDSYVRDDRLVLKRNPLYWDAPKPYLDSVVIRPILDDGQRFDTFSSGDADIMAYVIWSPSMVQSIKQGLDVRIPPISGGQGLIVNVRKAPLDDVRVRRALLLATDIEDLNKKVNDGDAAVIDSFFTKDSPFYSASTARPRTDLAAAQALIDQYLAEKGGSINLELLGTATSRVQNQSLQQRWSQLKGVKVSVQTLEPTAFVARQGRGEFDLAGSAIAGVDPEPTMSLSLETGSALNFGGFSDRALDKAIQDGRTATTVDQRAAAYRTLDKVFWEQVPLIPTFRLPYASVVRKGVVDFRLIDDGLPDFSATWLEQ
jgi:peptide/nickel transport system substrate-binding protein